MMRVTRRNLLAAILCSTALPLALGRSAFAQPSARPMILVLSGIGKETNPSTLREGMARLLDDGLPISIAVNPFGDDGEPILVNDAIAVGLRDLVGRYARLIEVCVDLGTVSASAPLAQLRHASDAQSALAALLNAEVADSPRPTTTAATAVTSSSPASAEDFRTMRAAGIRTAIHIGDDDEIAATGRSYWRTATGLANLVTPADAITAVDGSGHLHLDTVRSALDGMHHDAPAVLLVDVEALSGAEGLRNVRTLAGMLQGASENGVLRMLLPSTHYVQSNPDDIRRLILRFDGPVPDFDKLVDGLQATSLLSLTPELADKASLELDGMHRDLALLGWDDAATGTPDAKSLVAAAARSAFNATGVYPTTFVPSDTRNADIVAAAASAGIAAISAPIGDRDPILGLDKDGVLHLPETIGFGRSGSDGARLVVPEVLSRLSSTGDAVLAIDPRAVGTPEGLRDLNTVLAAVSAQNGTRISGFREYYDALVPEFAWVEKIRHTKATVRALDASDGRLTAADRARLMEDARLAWTFFEWGTTQYTGMVAGTASRRNGANEVGWPYATQWDIASHLNATLAARFLGLIDQATFDKMIGDTLALLPRAAFSYGGGRLPNTEIGLGGNVSTSRGYDSHDAGRLLIALGNVETFDSGRFPIADIVSGWNLDLGIVDGQIFSIAGNGTFIDGHHNSYAHYIRNGFVRWGYDPLPVYPDYPEGIEGEVGLVTEVARRGRIATEALLTEEVEVGGTDQIRLIADILLSAQIERHRETGILTCTSEGPLDFPPYFSYQGYQIQERGGEFVVDGRTDQQQALLRGMGQRARMVSTKGCFLWYAARPGAYATRLYEHIREHARIEGLGFSSGIHEGTEEALAVSDVNTNGLILEAIAYIFNGRRPLSELNRHA